MGTSIRIRKFQADYDERVYAGVLGLAIGIKLGLKHCGDARLIAARELGRIGYDLNARGEALSEHFDERLACALTAPRVFEDFGVQASAGPEQAAWTFLNYTIQNRSTLWWGGMGRSAQHSAYMRLKHGMTAPGSGSRAINGAIVSEQAGAEMLAPGLGLILPGDPARAADLAGKCASVFYDGEAVCVAQATAALVAAAFSAKNNCALFDAVLPVLPLNCAVVQMMADVHGWSATRNDWRNTRELLREKYFGVFPEGHALPQFAGILLALAHGGQSWRSALEVAALAGWGCATTLGILGCVMGVSHGSLELASAPYWLNALNDRLSIPCADAGRGMSDAATEALALVAIGRGLQISPCPQLKKGARYHFEMPGSTHGFAAEMSDISPVMAVVRNVEGHSRSGKRCLAIECSGLGAAESARVGVPLFCRDGKSGSPLLHPGQTLRAFVEADAGNGVELGVRPYIKFLGADERPEILRGPEKLLLPEARHEFKWTLPDGLELVGPSDTIRLTRGGAPLVWMASLLGSPIVEAGLEIFQAHAVERASANSLETLGGRVLYLDYFTWEGTPKVDLGAPRHNGTAWQSAWVNAATRCEFGAGVHALRICQDEGVGLLIQGTRGWHDYNLLAAVTPMLARSAGVAVRVQGMLRYYALLLCPGNVIRLVKQLNGLTVLAERACNWRFGQTVELGLSVEGRRLRGSADGILIFDFEDSGDVLTCGAAALIVEEGCLESGAVRIE